ncbi:MAG: Eco57I restriction-modification methylase domain-containing protein, partial [Elusimicrobia bacterium]|nr:Eco57I restriction-modification methylase domain-containing protein [Elusimicrobiota bacterium]
ILDPACGSGAFPMGILHKLTHILHTLDPRNELWEQKQLEKALLQDDITIREHLIVDIEAAFKNNELDYGRKLYLIKNCLYGIDIQPIAIQIAKLRFFISLIVDQKVDILKENFGIRSLPNLDFKLICANTLIGAPKECELKKENDLGMEIIDPFFEKFNSLTDKYFSAYLPNEKKNITGEIKKLVNKKVQDKIAEAKRLGTHLGTHSNKQFNKFVANKYKNQIEQKKRNAELWQSYNNLFKHESVGFFETKYFFPKAKDGFDIVIANPPYVRADDPNIKNQRVAIMNSKTFRTLWEKWDLYVAFIEKGYGLLAHNGILEFIIPDAYMSSKYAEKSHEYFLQNATISRINFCSDLKIFEAAVRNIIIEFTKNTNPDYIPLRIRHKDTWDNLIFLPSKKQLEMGENTFKLDSENKIIGDLSNTLIWVEICYVSKGMVLNSDEKQYKNEFQKIDLISETKDEIHSKLYIEAKWIKKYFIEKVKYLEWNTPRVPEKISRPTFPELYVPQKIIKGRMTPAIYDDKGLFCNDSCFVCVLWRDLASLKNRSIKGSIKKDFHINDIQSFRKQLEKNSSLFNLKYLLAILNSKFAYKFLDSVRRSQIGFYPDDLKKLPIKKISLTEQKPFVEIVDKIMAITQSDDYLENPAKKEKVKEYEKQIDQMVYKLYNLTNEEIKIVEQSMKQVEK